MYWTAFIVNNKTSHPNLPLIFLFLNRKIVTMCVTLTFFPLLSPHFLSSCDLPILNFGPVVLKVAASLPINSHPVQRSVGSSSSVFSSQRTSITYQSPTVSTYNSEDSGASWLYFVALHIPISLFIFKRRTLYIPLHFSDHKTLSCLQVCMF